MNIFLFPIILFELQKLILNQRSCLLYQLNLIYIFRIRIWNIRFWLKYFIIKVPILFIHLLYKYSSKTEKIRSLFKSYISQKNQNQKMIQKAVFQKRINQPTKKKINYQQQQNQNKSPIKKTIFRDISNELKTPQNSCSINMIDYKVLYELENQKCEQYCTKIELLEQKIRCLQSQNKELRDKVDRLVQKQEGIQQQQNQTSLTFIPPKKKSHKQIFFQQIRSFKQNLPNSMKIIQFQQLSNFQSVNLVTDQQIKSKKCFHQKKHPTLSDLQLKRQKSVKQISFQQQNIQKEQHIDNNNFNFGDQKSFIASSAATLKIINDESLIDCLAIYGLSENFKYDQELQEDIFEGEMLHCSKKPHQIVNHSTKLIFPQKVNKQQINILTGQQAIQQSVNLINQTLKNDQFKVFTLIFEPATMPAQDFDDMEAFFQQNINNKKQKDIIDIINKQRRFYAICLPYNDFDIVKSKVNGKFDDLSFENSLEEDIFKEDIKNMEEEMKKPASILKNNLIKQRQQNLQSSDLQKINTIKSSLITNNLLSVQQQKSYDIRISKKVLTFFTKYPFIPFFQLFLTHLLKQSFYSRKQLMKKNLTQIQNFSHLQTITFIKQFYGQLNLSYQFNKKFKGKINQIYQIKLMNTFMNRYQNISLELSKSLLKNFYSQIWAYPLLRLFTLDTFLDTFTLMMLEEKIIFVCENEHILTSMIFLFTKVLIRPFNYPYPVVSMIPSQFDYFNAPFPIVYGCLNSKAQILRQKIPKIYKNVYIFVSANGVDIYSYKNLTKILAKKSPKLRDKLLPSFIKIQQHNKQISNEKAKNSQINFLNLTSFLGFTQSNQIQQAQKVNKSQNTSHARQKYVLNVNNRQLSHQVIEKVYFYLNSIKDKLPSRKQVHQIKQKVQKQIMNEKKNNKGEFKLSKFHNADKQTYEIIKNDLIKKTTDPFVQKFLDTQIVGMEILK